MGARRYRFRCAVRAARRRAAEFEPCIDLMKHTSSTRLEISGNSSLTHIPLWPCCLNFQGVLSRLTTSPSKLTSGRLKGSGLPWSRFKQWFVDRTCRPATGPRA